MEPTLRELVVVGAGPHALALVARLLEEEPDSSGDFWIGLASRPIGDKAARDLVFDESSDTTASSANAAEAPRVRGTFGGDWSSRVEVVDPSGCWLAQWIRAFDTLRVPYLRSGVDVHPSPYSSQALWAFLDKQVHPHLRDLAALPDDDEEEDEHHHRNHAFGHHDAPQPSTTTVDDGTAASWSRCAMANSRQLEVERSRDYHGPFRAPSAEGFRRFCAHLLGQYPGLDSAVRKDRVVKITPAAADADTASDDGTDGRIRVEMESGRVVWTRHCVVATGPTVVPRIPAWATELAESAPTHALAHAWDVINGCTALGLGVTQEEEAATAPAVEAETTLEEAAQEANTLGPHTCPGLDSIAHIPAARVLIVGGGLTSAQLLHRIVTDPSVAALHPPSSSSAAEEGAEEEDAEEDTSAAAASAPAADYPPRPPLPPMGSAALTELTSGDVSHWLGTQKITSIRDFAPILKQRGVTGAQLDNATLWTKAAVKRLPLKAKPRHQKDFHALLVYARRNGIDRHLLSVETQERREAALKAHDEWVAPESQTKKKQKQKKQKKKKKQQAAVNGRARFVTIAARRPMLAKQFDISLDWVSWQCRPKRLKKFLHTKDFNARLAMLQNARERGSVTPEGMRLIATATELAVEESGAVEVCEGVEVEAAMWLEADELESRVTPRRACWEVYLSDGTTRHYDRIILATGCVFFDFHTRRSFLPSHECRAVSHLTHLVLLPPPPPPSAARDLKSNMIRFFRRCWRQSRLRSSVACLHLSQHCGGDTTARYTLWESSLACSLGQMRSTSQVRGPVRAASTTHFTEQCGMACSRRW